MSSTELNFRKIQKSCIVVAYRWLCVLHVQLHFKNQAINHNFVALLTPVIHATSQFGTFRQKVDEVTRCNRSLPRKKVNKIPKRALLNPFLTLLATGKELRIYNTTRDVDKM